MYTGRWSGTMQLAVRQGESDVGVLTTLAIKNPDGTYPIYHWLLLLVPSPQNHGYKNDCFLLSKKVD
jgi:hypothetical protein